MLEKFEAIDRAFAEKYGGSEEEKVLLATLFFVSRKGHLALRVGEKVEPDLEGLLGWNEEQLLPILRAAVVTCKEVVVQEGEFFFLKHAFEMQKKMLQLVKEKEAEKPQLEGVDFQVPLSLLEEQRDFLHHAKEKSLTLLVGGPGTGKTYTAAHFLDCFWNSLSPKERSNLEVALVAPTGKAAAHFVQSVQKVVQEESFFEHVEVGTLHALLDVRRDSDLMPSLQRPLSHDLVLVDEASMIDAPLMIRLFSSMKKGARLILIGDPYQLPPVEVGTLFADLCDLLNPILLQRCMRSELQAIVTLAEKMRLSSPVEVIAFLEKEKMLLDASLEELVFLALQGECSLLSPFRQGPFGVEQFNALCFNTMKAKQKPFCAPIILTENAEKQELYNGQMGKIFFSTSGKVERVSIQDREVACSDLPRYEFAYLLSVHKAQGSEFDHVILLVPQGSECFGKELFYTAVTRAKKSVQIVGKKEVIEKALLRPSRRYSALKVLSSQV